MHDNLTMASIEWPTKTCDELTDQELDTLVTRLQGEKERRVNSRLSLSKDTPTNWKTTPIQTLAAAQSSETQKEDNIEIYLDHSMDKAVDERRRVHVRGITQNTTQQQLEALFEGFQVEQIIIPKKPGRNGKYFAFVDIDTRDEARRAVEHLDLHALPGSQGLQIRMKIATPPKKQPGDTSGSNVPRDFSDKHIFTNTMIPNVINPSSSISPRSKPNNENQEDKPEARSMDDEVFNDILIELTNHIIPYHEILLNPNLTDEEKEKLRVIFDQMQAQNISSAQNVGFNTEEEQIKKSDSIAEEYDKRNHTESIADKPTDTQTMEPSPSTSSDTMNNTSDVPPQTKQDEVSSWEESRAKLGESENGSETSQTESHQCADPLAKQKAVVNTVKGVKTHCTFFLRTGYCDFMQQGCKYSHELPPGGIVELRKQAGFNPLSDTAPAPSPRVVKSGLRSGIKNPEVDFTPPSVSPRIATPHPTFDPHSGRKTQWLSSSRNQKPPTGQTRPPSTGCPRSSIVNDRKMSAASQQYGFARTNRAPGLEYSKHAQNKPSRSLVGNTNRDSNYFSRTIPFKANIMQHLRKNRSEIDLITPSDSVSQCDQTSRVGIPNDQLTAVLKDLKKIVEREANRNSETPAESDLIEFSTVGSAPSLL